MRNQHTALAEFQKFRKNVLNDRGIQNHLVADTGQLFNLKGNRFLRIYKSAEPFRNLPLFHLHGADLNDPVIHRAEPRRLQVKYHTGAVKALSPGMLHHFLQVVYQIAFHSVDHLKILVLGNGMACLCKCLDTAVVRDCKRRHPPGLCSL